VSEDLGIVIVGAGVVGAAIAHALRHHDLPVYVVEAEAHPGTGISSRNSGVIHAGLYYPPGSLKERLCRRGRVLLYEFAERVGVPFEKTGKYIVACDSAERAYLERLARVNAGSVPLFPVDALPAGIRAHAALFSPETGIVDIHALIVALLAKSGADLCTHQRVSSIESSETGARLMIDGEPCEARWVINAAGLDATELVESPPHIYARGSYFRVSVPAGIEVPALVYPAIPKNSPGLGIHLTRNLAGEVYLGPDVEWIEERSFAVDPSRAERFFEAASRYLPWLEHDHLSPGYAGIRPKLSRTESRDFEIRLQGHAVHCLGIESPGITAAMAIGEMIAGLIKT